MSIDAIRNSLTNALRNNRVTRDEIRSLVREATTSGNTIDAAERAELQNILSTHGSKFTAAAQREFARLLGSAPTPPTPPTPPAPPAGQPEKSVIETRQPWTTTYWPMAGSGNSDGSASSNLWAKDGALHKFDALLKARGKGEGARDFELKPALNWLVNKESGHYIPHSSLSETDAERTTGVDFNNNGKIDADVKWDFIDTRGQFGKDGKTESTMSVGWWGSCDKVALAGVLFQEPKKDVTIDGVTFTAQDIKGLLTVIADSQAGGTEFKGNRYDNNLDIVALKNGQQIKGTILSEVKFSEGIRRQEDWQIQGNNLPDEVKVKLLDGSEKTYKKAELSFVAREDKQDDPVLIHETITAWLKSGRPAVMDKDSGDHVWNYNFYKAEDTLYKDGLKPSWATDDMLKQGFQGPTSGGKIVYVERNVALGGGGGSERYRYWLEEKNGKFVNGGWAPGSSNPDFLWRPRNEATFTGKNDRNPFVDPKLVKELYEKSIAP